MLTYLNHLHNKSQIPWSTFCKSSKLQQQPWSRIHGPFQGHLFLVVIDSYSKWMDVIRVSSTSSQVTIKSLRDVFATHGLPKHIVSDNGTAFTSAEFKECISRNGIKHSTSAPFHPASNGLAEKAVQIFKNALKKMNTMKMNIDTKIARFLFKYRTTPHTTTGSAPCELLMGRRLRSNFDAMHPNLHDRVGSKQAHQKQYHDAHERDRKFDQGDHVYCRNFARGSKWIPGTIESVTGPLSYLVRLSDDRLVRRHQDQIIKDQSVRVEVRDFVVDNQVVIPRYIPVQTDDSVYIPGPVMDSGDNGVVPGPQSELVDISEPRRSQRLRTAPQRLDL